MSDMLTWRESTMKGRGASWLGVVNDALFGERERAPARVLVVDDEEAIRRLVERILREAGCDVVTAAGGAEAMAVAKRVGTIDLLVTDLMMPEMNGDELARRLRRAESDLPVLYLTGFSDRLFAERVTLWEGEAFLEKPSSINGLLEAAALLTSGRVNGTIARRRPALDTKKLTDGWLTTVR